MQQVLVLYASTRGDLAPSDYAAVVVGGSVHAGHHQRELVAGAPALLPVAAAVS